MLANRASNPMAIAGLLFVNQRKRMSWPILDEEWGRRAKNGKLVACMFGAWCWWLMLPAWLHLACWAACVVCGVCVGTWAPSYCVGVAEAGWWLLAVGCWCFVFAGDLVFQILTEKRKKNVIPNQLDLDLDQKAPFCLKSKI
jgi:hypothetical protein